MATTRARDLILAVIDGTPYENGKVKPEVRALDEYIEKLEVVYREANTTALKSLSHGLREACAEVEKLNGD